MEKLSEYTIAFKGLKEGNHSFDYKIGTPFFEHFENSLVDEAHIRVHLLLEKRNTFMSLVIRISGTVKQTCDLCLERFDQPVRHKAALFIKFGEDKSEDGDDVIWLHPDDYQFNVAHLIYEYICLSIPLKHVHPPRKDGSSGCNPEMLKKIEEYSTPSAGKNDSRWDQLKSLLNNN